MSWVNCLGYAASASVLATFCMSSMAPLRLIAIISNVLFAAFGALAHIYPVLLLHAILLPVNAWRLLQALADANELQAPAFAWVPWMAAILHGHLKLTPQWNAAEGSVSEWRRRMRERNELMKLSDADHRDIRISRCDAHAEGRKSFWRS